MPPCARGIPPRGHECIATPPLAATFNPGEVRCYDLPVTDCSMPGLNGLQVAREVRVVCPTIPIIIATGYAPDELRQAVAELGRAEILNKERTFEELGERATQEIGIGLEG